MDQRLVEFAMKQAGGEEQVKKAFYRKEMEKSLKKAKTLEDIVSLARSEEEWSDAMWALTRQELAELLGGTGGATPSNGNGATQTRRRRLTKEEVDSLREQILKVLGSLKEDEALSAGEIADKIGGDVDTRAVSQQVKALREAGQVEMQGTRWSACYFLAAS